MKKLSVLLIALILALAFTSCTAIKGAFVKCDVKFDLDGGVAGEGFVDSVTVKYGKTVAMSTPIRENFTFDGWYDGDTLYTAETPITKDVTLRAKWTFNNTYTLTFETNGMADVPASHPVIGELPTIPEAPVVEGYVFAGWYFDAEYTTRYFFDYPLTVATTLYGKFYDTTLGEYIVISNVEQLMAIKDDPTAKYLLACDINCKGETLTPIDEFLGEIEGNGYKIHNFTINETADTVGFIRTNKGTVQNLSFSDFTFDVLNNNAANKYYGMVAAINEGSVINCHLLDSKIKIDMTITALVATYKAYNTYIGGIAGYNHNEVCGCSNQATLNITSFSNPLKENGYGNSLVFNSWIGGIAGTNAAEAVLLNCYNQSDIVYFGKATGLPATSYDAKGEIYSRIGGLTGENLGSINNCYSVSNINCDSQRLTSYTKIDISVGGAIGRNKGEIVNSYSHGDINCKGDNNAVLLGGFTAYNQGKIYNCYTTTNMVCESVVTSVGGFVAENKLVSGYSATINKCFAISNITLASTPTNSGYIVATNTGTVKDCYYSENSTINLKTVVDEVETLEAITPTNTLGEAKAENELLSVDFLDNTLYFDRMVWFLVDGKLPELR